MVGPVICAGSGGGIMVMLMEAGLLQYAPEITGDAVINPVVPVPSFTITASESMPDDTRVPPVMVQLQATPGV